MELILGILACIGCIAVLILLVVAVALRFASDRMMERVGWPDEPATLDVQNHIGDSRPVR